MLTAKMIVIVGFDISYNREKDKRYFFAKALNGIQQKQVAIIVQFWQKVRIECDLVQRYSLAFLLFSWINLRNSKIVYYFLETISFQLNIGLNLCFWCIIHQKTFRMELSFNILKMMFPFNLVFEVCVDLKTIALTQVFDRLLESM